MLPVAMSVVFLGYWVTYYGLDLIRGGNDKFLDLGVPGRYKGPAPKDAGAGDSSTGARITDQHGQDAGPAATRPGVNDAPGSQFVAGGKIGANGDGTAAIPGQLNN